MATWQTLEEVKAVSQARGTALFVVHTGMAYKEYAPKHAGHGGAIVGTYEQLQAWLDAHPDQKPSLRVCIVD